MTDDVDTASERDTAPEPEAAASPPAAGTQAQTDPAHAGSNESNLLAVGAGLSLSVLVGVASAAPGGVALFVAFLGGVILAMVMAGSRGATLAGFLIGIVAWQAALGQLAPVAPTEWGAVNSTFAVFAVLIAVAATGAGLRVGGATDRATVDGDLAFVLGLTGVAAVVGFVVTFAAAPARASFEIPLAEDWTVIPRSELTWSENVTFGGDFTAVYKSTHVPTTFEIPAIGVTTVAGGGGSAKACYRMMDTWAHPSTPLYDSPSITRDTLMLPVGPAYREVHSATDDVAGTVVYGYGIARNRRVGLLSEDLCYILAITVPQGAEIGEEDVKAIAESFRFR